MYVICKAIVFWEDHEHEFEQDRWTFGIVDGDQRMRTDLTGGRGHRSTTVTKAAEIDFMNIKQLIGSMSGTELQ